MSFLSDRPIAKIVSGATLLITTTAYVMGIVPEANNEVLTTIIGGSMAFLFAASVPNKA